MTSQEQEVDKSIEPVTEKYTESFAGESVNPSVNPTNKDEKSKSEINEDMSVAVPEEKIEE